MRTNFILVLILIPLITLSCSNASTYEKDVDISTVSYRIDNFSPIENVTKTTISNYNLLWTAGDTIGIFPEVGSQVYFVAEPNGAATSASFNGGSWSFKANNVYRCYYPFIGKMYLGKTNIPVSFVGQSQTGISDPSHIGSHLYIYTDETSSSGESLQFTFHHLCCIIRPTLTLPAGTYTKLAITAPTNVFTMKGHFNLTSNECAIAGDEYSNQLQIELNNITLTEETTFYVYISSAPVNVQGTEITVSVLNNNQVELQCNKTPGAVYAAGSFANITCNTWTEVPQSMGLIIEDWGNGGTIGGVAD